MARRKHGRNVSRSANLSLKYTLLSSSLPDQRCLRLCTISKHSPHQLTPSSRKLTGFRRQQWHRTSVEADASSLLCSVGLCNSVSTSVVLLDEGVRCAKLAGGEGGGRNISNCCGGVDVGRAGTVGGEGAGSV